MFVRVFLEKIGLWASELSREDSPSIREGPIPYAEDLDGTENWKKGETLWSSFQSQSISPAAALGLQTLSYLTFGI
jgi:hypothetical protein